MFNQLSFNEEKGQYNTIILHIGHLVKTNGGKKNKA